MTESSRPETPDETWARLQAGNNTSPTQQLASGSRFKRRRVSAGYDVTAVDEFMATINRRSVTEIKDVAFPYQRFGGYDMGEVDNYLEDEIDRRRRA
jgi:DivIVA domain-containing protein